MLCSHELPCPMHTIRINITKDPPTIRIPRAVRADMTKQQIQALRDLVGGQRRE